MAKHQHQLQWRARPDGEWTFHSSVEYSIGLEQIDRYYLRHGEKRTFDYRVVDVESEDAIARAPEIPVEFNHNGTTVGGMKPIYFGK